MLTEIFNPLKVYANTGHVLTVKITCANYLFIKVISESNDTSMIQLSI